MGGTTKRASVASPDEQDAIAVRYLEVLLMEVGCDEHMAAAAWNPDAHAAALSSSSGAALSEEL